MHIAALDAASGAATAWNPDARYGVSRGIVDALAVDAGTRSTSAATSPASAGSRATLSPRSMPSAAPPPAGTRTRTRSGGRTLRPRRERRHGLRRRRLHQHRRAAAQRHRRARCGERRRHWLEPDARRRQTARSRSLAVSGARSTPAAASPASAGSRATTSPRWMRSAGVATAWNPSANGARHRPGGERGTVYAGGQFTSIGGQPRSRIAALDAATGLGHRLEPERGRRGQRPLHVTRGSGLRRRRVQQPSVGIVRLALLPSTPTCQPRAVASPV